MHDFFLEVCFWKGKRERHGQRLGGETGWKAVSFGGGTGGIWACWQDAGGAATGARGSPGWDDGLGFQLATAVMAVWAPNCRGAGPERVGGLRAPEVS